MDNLRVILLIVGVFVIAGIYFWETRSSRRRRAALDDELDTSYLDGLGEKRGRKDYGYTRGELPSLGDETLIEDPDDDDWVGPVRRREPVAVDVGVEFEGEWQPGEKEQTESVCEPSRAVGQPNQLAMDLGDDAVGAIQSLKRIVPRPLMSSDEAARGSPADQPEMVLALTVMGKNKEKLSGNAIVSCLEGLGFEHGAMDLFHHYGKGSASDSEPVYSVANAVNPGSFVLDEVQTLSTPGLAIFARLTAEDPVIDIFESMLEVGKAMAAELDAELCDQSRNVLSKQTINHLREQIVEFTRKTRLKS